MQSCINYIVGFFGTASIIKLLFICFTVSALGTVIYQFANDLTNYILYLLQ
ncbi:hypothetical protein SAMN05216235_2386 [Salinicoccus halodurans]|uniref:Uncharacterized protein n=1 Tax=Salinicoccus halodurans TaxID=407035 RepID=A0AA94KX78_9STAP|nr:hypothetical protein SAMN05216235_2386 [Salinicoccus halodurans]